MTANYWAYPSGYNYDVNPTEGYHPAYATGDQPYTSPIGAFEPNRYGLRDMIGNVWEWCWDWLDVYWYTNAVASANDTRGPNSGQDRIVRGGSWNANARNNRVAVREGVSPWIAYPDLGFRLAMPAP